MEMKNVKEIFLGGAEEITIANTSKSFTSSSIYSSYSFLDVYSTSQSNLGQQNILKINFTITSNQGSPYIESMITYYDENGSLRGPEFNINGTTNFEITTKLTRTVDSNTWEVLLIQQYDSYGTGNDIRVQLAKTGTNFLDIYVKNQIASSMFTLTINSIKLINSTSLPVKKITNSNGNIIWGSYAAFPYRILEYIDIPAGCYISTNDNGNSTIGYYIDANFNLNNDTLSSSEFPFGAIYYNGTRYYRYHLITNYDNNFSAGYAGGSFTALFPMTNINQRHVIELNYRTYNDKKAYCDNVDKGAFEPTSGTNTGLLYIGGRRFNNNGPVSINDYPHTIRLYNMKQKTGETSNTYFYPVQRKSDGKIGLVKSYNNGSAWRFCTTETSVEPTGGPVVQEYYDGIHWA